jgi:Zn-finger protein
MTSLNDSIEIIDISDDNETLNNQEMKFIEENQTKSEFSSSKQTTQTTHNENKNDYYCWICHEDGDLMILCDSCSRSYHVECSNNITEEHDEKEPWECDECKLIRDAKQEQKILGKVSREQFDSMLGHILKRISYQGTEVFQKPVDIKDFPEYYAYVVTPMDFSTIENVILFMIATNNS